MPRKVLFTIATAITSAVIGMGSMSASAGLLDDVNETVNDVRDTLGGNGDRPYRPPRRRRAEPTGS